MLTRKSANHWIHAFRDTHGCWRFRLRWSKLVCFLYSRPTYIYPATWLDFYCVVSLYTTQNFNAQCGATAEIESRHRRYMREATVVQLLYSATDSGFVRTDRLCLNTLGSEILGEGQSGRVHKGVAERLPTISRGRVPVAVKMIPHFSPAKHLWKFMTEVEIMTKVGRHINILCLFGISFKQSTCEDE